MRQRTRPKIQESRRILPKEVMEEEPMKKITRCQFTFEDEAYIIKRRAELENFGKNDAEIARMIAKEKRWKPGTIISKIQRFIKEGKLSENNHKKERRDFSFEDVIVP